MNRPRILRLLRIGWSAGCVISCVLLIALWVRSYGTEDRAQGCISPVGIRLYSSRGWLVLFKNSTPGAGPCADSQPWHIALSSDHWLKPSDSRLGFSSPARFFNGSLAANISLPHWLLIAFSGSIASFPWLRWRFSLRTLLIVTTLVAVVLGLIVWM
jgi:hypothetical protein